SCLGAACAEWAVQAADEFTEDFCKRMALPARGLAWCDVNTRQPRARDFEIERSVSSAELTKGTAPPNDDSHSDIGG
ncbi:MAG TPA: hypothetical protein VGQ52_15815, partial [Gemmatimonadaceae bacterium]|nr:hypothetical protein [Gemmatimonadaceae bacterium]